MRALSLVLDDDGTVLCPPAVRAIVESVRSVARASKLIDNSSLIVRFRRLKVDQTCLFM